MRRGHLVAAIGTLLSCHATEELPTPQHAPDPEPAMQAAVLAQVVSYSHAAVTCVKVWPQQPLGGPPAVPLAFAELPDPAPSAITQGQSSGSTLLVGSACTVTHRGNTVTDTGAPASAVILHGAVWHGASAEIAADLLQGIDGDRLIFRLTPVGVGFRAELLSPRAAQPDKG
jgi:hypothetical protein